MSKVGLAAVDQASGVRVAREPHASHPPSAPALTVDGVEAHTSHQRGLRAIAVKAGRFLLHLGEMLLAMVVGMGILNVLLHLVLAPLGYTLDSTSDLYEIVMTVFMVVPMVAWMRVRGMAGRPIAEMSAAMVGVPVLLICVGALSVLDRSAVTQLERALMLPSMLVPMLLRLNYYTGSHSAHHAHAG